MFFRVHNTYGFSSLVVDIRCIMYIYICYTVYNFYIPLKLLRDVGPKHGGLKDVFAFQKGDVQVPCYCLCMFHVCYHNVHI